jgi:hypothetical protein
MSGILRHGTTCFAAAALLIALAGAARGGGVVAVRPAVATPDATAADRDMGLAIRARKSLLRDPQLGPLNLGVCVRDGIATLWGPVPSPELSFRAEANLRSLVELIGVRNELWVTGEMVPAAAPQQPPPFLPPPPPPNLPQAPALTNPPPLPARAVPAVVAPPANDEIELPPLRLPQRK